MASTAYTILSALDTILKADSGVSAIITNSSYFYIFEDEITIVNEKKTFPFLTTDIEVRETVNADNMRRYDYERHKYKILISFAVREKSKSDAKKNIWTLAEAIEDAYRGSKSLSDNVKVASDPSDIATDALKFRDENFWIGRGFMTFDVEKDICLRN